jgi:serine/threonine protein kinase
LIADRYRPEWLVGRGATGTVWAAWDELLRRRVALKKIDIPRNITPAAAEELRERTLREARAVAALSHPHVVTLYDIVAASDTGPVMVLEFVDGTTLARILADRGPLPPGAVATVGVAVASALLQAHALGIIHRDVKPSNILITHQGAVKLSDFGIARRSSESSMTAPRVLLGSPAYLAPELATGEAAGPASDAWSLGATMFTCVEGRPPFDRGNALETVASVVNDPVPALVHAGPLQPAIVGLLVKSPPLRMTLDRALVILREAADDPSGMDTGLGHQ